MLIPESGGLSICRMFDGVNNKDSPASLSMSCNCSPVFMSLNFCGIKLHTLSVESAKPTANKLESSATSDAVTLKFQNPYKSDVFPSNYKRFIRAIVTLDSRMCRVEESVETN